MARNRHRRHNAPLMRGGLFSEIASAFRLRRVGLDAAGLGRVTARRALEDLEDVGRERHRDMIRATVDSLFTAEYFATRGIIDILRAEHNRRVTDALDSFLTRWDQSAAWTNSLGDPPEVPRATVAFLWGIPIDGPLRIAAYAIVYGHLHSCLTSAPAWLHEPGVKGWWKDVEARAMKPIRSNSLGGIDKNTINAIKSGKSVPRHDIVMELAKRLAVHGIKDRALDRTQPKEEIEFELRFACALAEVVPQVTAFLADLGEHTMELLFQVLAAILAKLSEAEVVDLMRSGVASPLWPAVHGVLRNWYVQMLVAQAESTTLECDQMLALARTDPDAALARMAAQLEQQVQRMRSRTPNAGQDEFGLLLAECLEFSASLYGRIAGSERPIPTLRPGFHEELRAAGLCHESNLPWANLRSDEREQWCRDALRICPTSAYAHRTLATHLRSSGQAEEALLYLREAVRLDPANLEGVETLCAVLIDRGEHAEVLALTENAASATLWIIRAAALVDLGRADEARPVVEHALQENPQNTIALGVLAECEAALGRKREAATARRKAMFYRHGVRRWGSSRRRGKAG